LLVQVLGQRYRCQNRTYLNSYLDDKQREKVLHAKANDLDIKIDRGSNGDDYKLGSYFGLREQRKKTPSSFQSL